MDLDCQRSRLRERIAGKAIRWLSLSWLIFHIGLTVAYVLPPNPASDSWQQLLDATIGKYFSQNWQLFAPDPLAQNYALYVRPLTAEQTARISKEGLPNDGWFDLTNPLLVHFQEKRFAAYDRLTRPQINAILNWLTGGQSLAVWQRSCQSGDPKACVVYGDQLKLIRVEAGKLLTKVASAFCRDAPQSCNDATHVALRAHEELGVPWSKRYAAAKPETHDVDLGVYSLDNSVAAANIYTYGRHE